MPTMTADTAIATDKVWKEAIPAAKFCLPRWADVSRSTVRAVVLRPDVGPSLPSKHFVKIESSMSFFPDEVRTAL